jgi:hypothetical protein
LRALPVVAGDGRPLLKAAWMTVTLIDDSPQNFGVEGRIRTGNLHAGNVARYRLRYLDRVISNKRRRAVFPTVTRNSDSRSPTVR